MRSIYFDYNATTPLDAEVLEFMLPYMTSVFGNPSSIHHIGRKARADLDEARERMASVFQAKPSEIIFTSGGTESDNLAVAGTARFLKNKGTHLITSSIEHHALLHPMQYLEKKEGFSVSYIQVDRQGLVDPDDVKKAIRPGTTLVSIMAANNETGGIQSVAEIGNICRERGVLFHTDAAQALGKLPFESIHQFNADLVSVCAHKFHGPKGAGALYVRSPLKPDPILFGGGHENELRAGTENLAGVIGLSHAVELFLKQPVFPAETLTRLTLLLCQAFGKIEGVHLAGPHEGRLPNTAAFTIEGCDSISLLAGLDIEGVCASSGSACSAGSLEPSHVLQAMQVAPELAKSFVRFSLGRESTIDEVEAVAQILPRVVERIRASARPHGMASR